MRRDRRFEDPRDSRINRSASFCEDDDWSPVDGLEKEVRKFRQLLVAANHPAIGGSRGRLPQLFGSHRDGRNRDNDTGVAEPRGLSTFYRFEYMNFIFVYPVLETLAARLRAVGVPLA